MSDSNITGAGVALPAESYVTPDGITLFGGGVAENPLTADGALQTLGGFVPLFAATSLPPGTPVYPASYSASTGLTTLAQASAATAATAGVIGLAIPPFSSGKPPPVTTGGALTLTTAQWDAVVQGESGGLAVGQTYYLNSNGAQKPITTTQPGSDQYVSIGTAISPTTMVLKISAPNDSAGG